MIAFGLFVFQSMMIASTVNVRHLLVDHPQAVWALNQEKNDRLRMPSDLLDQIDDWHLDKNERIVQEQLNRSKPKDGSEYDLAIDYTRDLTKITDKRINFGNVRSLMLQDNGLNYVDLRNTKVQYLNLIGNNFSNLKEQLKIPDSIECLYLNQNQNIGDIKDYKFPKIENIELAGCNII